MKTIREFCTSSLSEEMKNENNDEEGSKNYQEAQRTRGKRYVSSIITNQIQYKIRKAMNR